MNLIGFKLIGHLGSEGMQNFAAGLLSKNHIEVRKRNPQPGKGGSSYSIENRYEPAIAPGEFGAIPVPTSYNGSLFWLVHQGWNPVMLRYLTAYVPDKYEAKIDARWLSDKDRTWNQVVANEPPNDGADAEGKNAENTQQKGERVSAEVAPVAAKGSSPAKIGISSSLTEED